MMSDDEEQDRDQSGRRVRSFAATGGIESEDDEDVNEAQMVDLSESEDEEEEDDLTADFTHVEGEVSRSTRFSTNLG
jgi:DNA-directed RNA polymerase III subunit RPC4